MNFKAFQRTLSLCVSFYMPVCMAACLAVCLFAPAAASAQTASPTTATREVILTFTSKSFQQIVQSLGFDTTRNKDDKGKDEDWFSFRAEGYKVVAFTNDGYLQLYMGFTDVKPTLKAVNEWNSKHSLTRAYVDKDGNASLECDLFTEGGVPRETVEAYVKTFRDLVGGWATFSQAHQS